MNYSDPFGLCVWDLCIGEAAATYATVAAIGTASFIVAKAASDWLSRRGNMRPDPTAQGPHTTFIPDATGRVKKYQDWIPNEPRHPNDPHRFKPGRRYDREGPPHTNPDGSKVPTPHINEPNGTARPPKPSEVPR